MTKDPNGTAWAERFRCALARIIYTRFLLFHSLALWLTPKGHPWRTLAQSAYQDLSELTCVTLRPRKDGKARVKVARQKLAWGKIAVGYLAIETTTRAIPGPIGHLTGSDDVIHLVARLSSAGSAFLGA